MLFFVKKMQLSGKAKYDTRVLYKKIDLFLKK